METNKEIEALLPRTHCPASCNGHGTYAVADENGDPEAQQCQWCYEVVIPLRENLVKVLSQAEARGAEKALQQVLDSEEMVERTDHIDTSYGDNYSNDGRMPKKELGKALGHNQAITAIRKKINSIKQDLSPPTLPTITKRVYDTRTTKEEE